MADLAVASLTITYEREHVIDFTTPYQDLGLTFLIAKDAPNNQFWHFLTPFQWDLWGAVSTNSPVQANPDIISSGISPIQMLLSPTYWILPPNRDLSSPTYWLLSSM